LVEASELERKLLAEVQQERERAEIKARVEAHLSSQEADEEEEERQRQQAERDKLAELPFQLSQGYAARATELQGDGVSHLPLEEQRKIGVLTQRAEKKWNQLDANRNGVLDGDELLLLADWVWCSFHPGHAISSADRIKEAKKILSRCDTNGDGVVDQAEFMAYYARTSAAMQCFHQAQAEKAKQVEKAKSALKKAQGQKEKAEALAAEAAKAALLAEAEAEAAAEARETAAYARAASAEHAAAWAREESARHAEAEVDARAEAMLRALEEEEEEAEAAWEAAQANGCRGGEREDNARVQVEERAQARRRQNAAAAAVAEAEAQHDAERDALAARRQAEAEAEAVWEADQCVGRAKASLAAEEAEKAAMEEKYADLARKREAQHASGTDGRPGMSGSAVGAVAGGASLSLPRGVKVSQLKAENEQVSRRYVHIW